MNSNDTPQRSSMEEDQSSDLNMIKKGLLQETIEACKTLSSQLLGYFSHS